MPEVETLASFENIDLEEELLAQKDNSSISKGYTSIDAGGDVDVNGLLTLNSGVTLSLQTTGNGLNSPRTCVPLMYSDATLAEPFTSNW